MTEERTFEYAGTSSPRALGDAIAHLIEHFALRRIRLELVQDGRNLRETMYVTVLYTEPGDRNGAMFVRDSPTEEDWVDLRARVTSAIERFL